MRSPENAAGKQVPFAGHFAYTLYDQKSGRAIWKHAQSEKEASPVSVFVHNKKWTAIWTGWNQLIVLDPESGADLLMVNILDQFPEHEREQYVHRTTAGPSWAGWSRWDFREIDGRLYFVIRAWWDRRIVVDLMNRKTVADEGELKNALDRFDREFALNTLREYASGARLKNHDECGICSDLADAVHLAGRMYLRETIPALRLMEAREDAWSSSTSGGWGLQLPRGEVNPFNYESNNRAMVQLALRRLGAKPACYPSRYFYYPGKEGDASRLVPVPQTNPQRSTRTGEINSGIKPVQVLGNLGPPDYLPTRGERDAWEYDMDSDPPYTLRILWDDHARIQRIEKVRPAIWQRENGRYED